MLTDIGELTDCCTAGLTPLTCTFQLPCLETTTFPENPGHPLGPHSGLWPVLGATMISTRLPAPVSCCTGYRQLPAHPFARANPSPRRCSPCCVDWAQRRRVAECGMSMRTGAGGLDEVSLKAQNTVSNSYYTKPVPWINNKSTAFMHIPGKTNCASYAFLLIFLFSDCCYSCNSVPALASRNACWCLLPQCRRGLFCRQYSSSCRW